MPTRAQIEHEVDQVTMVIAAAEKWSTVYTKDPASHAKVIKTEAKLGRVMRGYFKDLATDRVWKYINWTQYHTDLIAAYDVNVIFDDDGFEDAEGDMLIGVMHDPLLDGMGAGIAAGQAIYDREIGMTSSSASVLKAARQYSAQLVKGVNATTKDRIQQSIQTSLTLGENQSDAAARITNIVNDPKRAEVIARTEAVNSYTKGLLSFGGESGASAKVWQALDATDECADLDGEQVDINDEFDDGGGDGPPLHPNCRCGLQLIYKNANGSESEEEDDDANS